MAKNFYAVKRGFDKDRGEEITDKIFTDWKDVSPLVKGYSQARYKGFETEDAAKTWLSVVDKLDGLEATETFVKGNEIKPSGEEVKGLEYFTSEGNKPTAKDLMDLFEPAFKELNSNMDNMSVEDRLSILVTINSRLYNSLGLLKQ